MQETARRHSTKAAKVASVILFCDKILFLLRFLGGGPFFSLLFSLLIQQ